MKTAVINNREALVQGQMQPRKAFDGSLLIGDVLTLVPGLNLVDKEQLAELRKNPAFERNFTSKIPPSLALEQNPEKVGKPILMVMDTVGKDGKSVQLELEDETPLAKLSPEVCKRLIDETLMPDTLRTWDKSETRPAIRFLIEQQLEAIGSGKKTGGPATVRE